jgi:hypothetical protein
LRGCCNPSPKTASAFVPICGYFANSEQNIALMMRVGFRPKIRNKQMKNLIVTLAIIFLPSTVYANFSITFENTLNKKMFYMLFWIDHAYDWPKPVNVAGGELEALKIIDFDGQYEPGTYFVVWRDSGEWKHRMLLVIRKDVAVITVTPQKWIPGNRGP